MRTVLLIEDNLWLGKAYARTLELAGYKVLVAKSAAEAIKKIDQAKIEIVLLDMFLPDATGMQFLHEIKSYDDTFSIPIIVCTANPGKLSLELLSPYGVLTILDKATLTPFSLQQAIKEVTVDGNL